MLTNSQAYNAGLETAAKWHEMLASKLRVLAFFGPSKHRSCANDIRALKHKDVLNEPSWYCHLKTGGVYRVLHEGKLEADLTKVVIYEAADGTVWVSPATEFFDGRFVEVPDNGR